MADKKDADLSSDGVVDAVPGRRRIQFFFEKNAPSLHEAGIMDNKNSPVANAGIAQMLESGLKDGYVLKCLFQDRSPNGFSLCYAWFKGNYTLPPHKHSADCLYYVISGEIHMGKHVLKAGDGFLLPANAGYSYSAGPDGLEVLEFRASPTFDITINDGSDEIWRRLSGICAANRDLWKVQKPPMRSPQVASDADS